MQHIHDVAIVGAGPAGSAAASYLASGGLDVLLLDKFDFPRDKTCGDGLTPRALRVLEEMGILEALLQVGHCVNNLEVVAPQGHTVVAPIATQDGAFAYVLVVRRLTLDHLILNRATASGATFERPVRVTRIEQDTSGVIVHGQRHECSVSYRARFVIVATGANIALLLHSGLLKRPPLMILAARAYYEDMPAAPDHIQCRFDGVPLPGYGWVFPLSDSSANVGAGFFQSRLMARWMPDTARKAFDDFVATAPLKGMLTHARRTGPIKGYPLRIDFASAPTFSGRVMLAGEAAGLVNPVTGEGIDYALESGKMAAEHLLRVFTAGDLARPDFAAYDQRLRQRYQRLFVLSNRLRLVYLNPIILNRVVRSAANSQELRDVFMRIVLENQEIDAGLSPRTLLSAIIGGPR